MLHSGDAFHTSTKILDIPVNEVHVWYAWTAACDTPMLRAYYLSLLSPEEGARMQRFAFEHLKLEYLVTRALCRTVLSAYANAPPQSWRFQTNRYGRPEIEATDAPSQLRFNLSNARSLVACVITHALDAGIDVEEIDRRGETVSIADRFFSPQELKALHAIPEEQQRERFFELWTLKESYIKARGMGLSIPLDQFSFSLSAQVIRIAFDPRLADEAGDWQFALLRPSALHRMALAVRRAPQQPFCLRLREVVPGFPLTWKDMPCAC